MANPYFRFKEFLIRQDKCAMKVGTDGVLLGAWAEITNVKSILDIGTGTGLIALMLAQRSSARIDAIETDGSAAFQASENINASPWKERIRVQHISFADFVVETKNTYDLIIANPPYFKSSLPPENLEKRKARHSESLSYVDIFEQAKNLLQTEGRICLILPAIFEDECISKAGEFGLSLNKLLKVKPTPLLPPKRILFDFSFQPCAFTSEEIVIEENGRHNYSAKYKALTKEFYLNF